MTGVKDLQRHHELLALLQKELNGSLVRLVSDFQEGIDARTGRRASYVTEAPGLAPMCYGLEWSVKDEPWSVISNAEKVIAQMKKIRTDVAAEPRLDGFSNVPDENWNEYMALYRKYSELRDEWYRVLERSKRCWDDKVAPFLSSEPSPLP